MKQASIRLPFIQLAVSTAPAASGFLDHLDELPNTKITVTSTMTGLNTDLYFYVTAGEKSIDEFNAKFIVAELAKNIAETIRVKDLLNDGVGKIHQKIPEKYIFQAEELRRNLPFSSSLISSDPDFYMWIATEGDALAKRLLASVKADSKKRAKPSVWFAIDDVVDGSEVGSIILPLVNGAYIQGQLYLGDHPEKVDEKTKGGLNLMVLDAMKEYAGIKKYPYAVVFERETRRLGDFAAQTQTFTAVLDMPFRDSGDWFKKGTLVNLLNETIDRSLQETINLFGGLNVAKE